MKKIELNANSDAILDEIDEFISKQQAARPFPVEVAKRIKIEFLPDRVTASLNIEGIGATKRQTLAMMDAMTLSTNSSRAEVEILNALKADELIFQEAQSAHSLSLSLIREINRIILESVHDNAGGIRSENVQITGAAFQPPNHFEVVSLLENMVNEFNSGFEAHAVVKSAWLHATFTHIHPFNDGNGRTGRLLQDYALLQRGYYPTGIPSHRRDDYYDALQSADGGDLNDIIQIIGNEQLKVISRVQAILNDHKTRGKFLSTIVKTVSNQKRDTEYKKYLLWKHRMETAINQIVSLTEELSSASPDITIKNERYDIIDFATWRQLAAEGKAPNTWALAQMWGIDGNIIYRNLFFFSRHRFRSEDPFPKDDLYQRIGLFFTGAVGDDKYEFYGFCDKDIKIRQIIHMDEEWLVYNGTGEMMLNDFHKKEKWNPVHTSDLSRDVFQPLVRDVLSSKGGVEFN